MLRDESAGESAEGHPVILFDGICTLCNWVVQFIIPRDPNGTFRFASLQSDAGSRLLSECGLPTDNMDTLVLVEDGDCYTKSDAALRIASHLGGAYRLLTPFRAVPRFVRDAVYDVVAEHRYQWFGRKDQCTIPSPDARSRFLADGQSSRTSDDE